MNKTTETIVKKYAEYFLINNREVMAAEEINELEQALKQSVGKTSVIEEVNDEQMIKEAQAVIDKLWWCADNPGDKITITVGDTTANLYDHAALVQTLADSLEYFISEMQA